MGWHKKAARLSYSSYWRIGRSPADADQWDGRTRMLGPAAFKLI